MFRLDVGGRAYAVKEVLNPWDLADWFDRLDEAWVVEQRAIDAGVDAPAPIPDPGTGSWRVDVERVGGRGTAIVRVHRWVDGDPAPRGPASPALARWCGGTLARLHRLALQPNRDDVFPPTDDAAVRRWPELLESLDHAGVPWVELAWGKRLGLVAFGTGFVVVAGLAPCLVVRWAVDDCPSRPLVPLALLAAQTIVLLTLARLLSSAISPMASGVVAVGLFGATWIAGVVGGIGASLDNESVARVGSVSRMLLPTDGLWRGAMNAFQGPSALVEFGGRTPRRSRS